MAHAVLHHPAVRRVPSRRRLVPPGYFIEFGGAITPAEWAPAATGVVRGAPEEQDTPATPDVDEEYFEWLDLLEAVEQANGTFVMVELGAGYGRWSVRGALAARARGLEAHCVAVEAEPTHAAWLRRHFIDNDLRPDDHELIWGAVGIEAGFVPFHAGDAAVHYGQYIAERADAPYPGARERRRLRARSVLGRPPRPSEGSRGPLWVPAISLAELLVPFPVVDLIDIDVQGAELPVLTAAIHRLNTHVRRVHAGTHGADIARGLRQLFTDHGWECLHDYPGQSMTVTPYGPIRFVDGVQSWVNPEVDRQEERRSVVPAARDAELERLKARVRALKQKVAALKAER